MQFRQSQPGLHPFFRLLSCSLLIEGGILLLAALLRLWELDLKPPHFDEGINGWFVDQMRTSGFYKYDPENYHGPIYFYGLFVSLTLLGRNLWALRLPAVLASIASVWVALRFDRYFGVIAVRCGALALALSPAAVFYARYAIHESWMMLSLMITAWGILGLWQNGSRRDLMVTIAGITLLLLIKETAIIHISCFLIAAGVLLLWERIVPSQSMRPFAKQSWRMGDLAWCCGVSAFALVFFYSGTFLNFPGVEDFFRAYAKWFHTGVGDGGHVKDDYQVGRFSFLNYYWLALMARYEWPAIVGLLYAVRLAGPVRQPGSAMMRYLAIYGIGSLVAYSIVPYKTPWCIISIIWPLALLFGCAVQEGWEMCRIVSVRIAVTLVAVALLCVSLNKTLRLNFRHFADPEELYVYVQTMPEIDLVTKPVLGLAKRDARNYGMSGEIVLDSYYPLPWIFGDFTSIGYYGTDMPLVLDGDFIVALSSQQKSVEQRIREPYLRQRFHLRDAMEECTVWFKESRFHDWFAEPGHGSPERVVPLKK